MAVERPDHPSFGLQPILGRHAVLRSHCSLRPKSLSVRISISSLYLLVLIVDKLLDGPGMDVQQKCRVKLRGGVVWHGQNAFGFDGTVAGDDDDSEVARLGKPS